MYYCIKALLVCSVINVSLIGVTTQTLRACIATCINVSKLFPLARLLLMSMHTGERITLLLSCNYTIITEIPVQQTCNMQEFKECVL